MAKLGWIAGASALLLATSAHALGIGVVDAAGQAANDLSTYGGGFNHLTGNGRGSLNNDGAGGSYSSFVNVGRTEVDWESANAVTGYSASFYSSSQVDITFNNPNGDVTPHLLSSITPAGFGFYMADRNSPGCSVETVGSCGLAHGVSFGNLPNSATSGPPIGVEVGPGFSSTIPSGYADFDFSVWSGETQLFDINGSVLLTVNGGNYSTTLNLNDPNHVLADFTSATADGSYNAFGFAWGVNPLDVTLLGGAGTQVISYRTTVSASINNACASGETFNSCLVAYSGFGDPIGRGGGDSFALTSALSTASLLETDDTGIGDITGVNFQHAVFNFPTYDPQSGNLSFDFVGLASDTPEPATWMTLILGFGLLGGTLRRRRVLA
jgi:hypothetical protein